MYCEKCGKSLEEDSKFCIYCGAVVENTNKDSDERNTVPMNTDVQQQAYDPGAAGQQFETAPVREPKKPKKEKKPKKKISKGKLILIISVVVILAAALTVGAFFLKEQLDPANKMMDALEDGDLKAAASYYNDVDDVSDLIIKSITECLDKIYIDFKNGDIGYEVALSKLDIVAGMNISETTEHLAKITKQIEALNGSRTAYELAQSYEDNGDYPEAIESYKDVIKDDNNYGAAMEALDAVSEKYRNKILGEAEAEAAQKDYKTAIKKIDEGLSVLKDDVSLTKQRTLYMTTYIDSAVEDIDKLIADGKYDEANALITEASGFVGGNDLIESKKDDITSFIVNDYLSQADALVKEKKYEDALFLLEKATNEMPAGADKFNEKIKEINELKPTRLSDLKVIDSKNYEYTNGLFEDSFGYEYTEAHVTHGEAFVYYNLDKKYTTISGTFVAAENYGESGHILTATIEIYLDDALVKTIDKYTKSTGGIDFKLDVRGKTKIEFRFDDNEMWDADSYIAIVNDELTK